MSPFVSDNPVAPVEPPTMWAMLAWARRQFGQPTSTERSAVAGIPTPTSQTVDTTPVPAVSTFDAAASPTNQPDAVTADSAVAVSVPLSATQLANAAVTVNLAAAAVATTPPALVQVSAAVPQTSQSAVAVTYTGAQTAGDTNIVAVGWNNTTSTLTAVTDSAGNTYQLAVPTARGSGISQAIYYAPNIKAAPAGTNTVTATFDAATPYVDLRALEYSGLDPVSPFDVGASASGTGTSATSGAVTTTAANALIFGAGTTTGGFAAEGTDFTTRIITTPDADIAGDRIVTSTGTYSATAPLNGSAPGSCRSPPSGLPPPPAVTPPHRQRWPSPHPPVERCRAR